MSKRHVVIGSLWVVAIVLVLVVQRLRAPRAEAPPRANTTRTERAVPVRIDVDAAPRMLHGDRQHRGRSRLRGPNAPVLAWTFTAGAPIVAQAVVDPRGRVVVGALDKYLYVLDARTGALVWRKDLGGPIYGAALVLDDGTIFVGSDGQALHALSPEGEIRFRVPTNGDPDTSPTLAPDGTIRFCAGSELWSITKTGETRFRFRAGAKIFSSPAVRDDGVTVFGSQDDHVYGVDAEGHEVFRFRTGGDVDATPTIADDGTILVGSNDGSLYALDLDGKLRFELDVGAMVRAPITVSGNRAFVGTLGPEPRVLAIDLTTGRVLFAFELTRSEGSDVGVMSGALVDADGTLYFGAHDDFLYAVDANGRLRWAFPTHGDIDGTPTLVGNGAIVFGSEDAALRLVSTAAR